MATIRTVEATKVNNTLTGAGYSPNPVNEQNGAIRMAYFSYYASDAIAQNDVLELCQLPAGARVLGITLATSGLGNSSAGTIGDAGDADRLTLAANTSITSAAQADLVLRVDSTDTDENPAFGYGYRYTADTVITLTVTTASNTAGVLRGHIEYTLN